MKIVRILAGLSLLMGVVNIFFARNAIAAPSDQAQIGVNSIGGTNSPTLESVLVTGINVFLFIIGALAVIMLIYGGYKYIISAGDASRLKSAKDTIMYAVIGLIVVVLAYSIANFVVNIFEKDPFTCNSSIDPGCNPN